MRGRSDASGKSLTKGRRKATAQERPSAPKARTQKSFVAGEETEVAQLRRELKEALEQQAAASEVLNVINSSPGDLKAVFEAMLGNAVRLCEAKFGFMARYDGEAFHIMAQVGATPAYLEFVQRGPLQTGPETILGQVLSRKQAVQIPDLAGTHGYAERNPLMVAAVELGGVRTYLAVPMFKENEITGAVLLYRQEVRPFNDKQVALLTSFAAQAVIATENARLLNELRESLHQQTATADVLKVISRSAFDLQSVFDTIAVNAVRLCHAHMGAVHRYDGELIHIVAHHNFPPDAVEVLQKMYPRPPQPDQASGRAILTRKVAQIEDMLADPQYTRAVTIAGHWGSILAVPMLRDGAPVGAIVITRDQVGRFADGDIDLLKTFADQAVIAIENTRLLNELHQRTDDLTESLEQQTATSEVLKVISSSPGELGPVFDAMLENATRICEANCGTMMLYEGDAFRIVALHGAPIAFSDERQRQPMIRPEGGHHLLRLVETKKLVHIADISADPALAPTIAKFAGARTLLTIPMLKENELVGAMGIYRQEVRPFSDKQIALVQNFAAQAVIAIENARLLNELNKLNQQLERRVADQVGEIERMGKLRRFLPPQVADLIVASGAESQLESHRREITALFCDLRGFTGFSESSDPEDVMALLREYHAAIGEIIIKYSGTLERYAGDGVMVIFNDPVPVPNPALQAVKMALDMRVAIGALIEKWRRLGHDLGFGIGIAHGFATLGTVGFEGRFDYAAIGTVSNVASRLCDEAKPGQILISPRVLLAVEDAIGVEAAGEFELKGIRRPMAAHNVLTVKPAN